MKKGEKHKIANPVKACQYWISINIWISKLKD